MEYFIFLSFVIIVLGLCLGNIKIKGISLDLSAVLIVAVAFGICIFKANIFSQNKLDELNLCCKLLSSLGMSLFVSVIGISAGYTLTSKNKSDICCIFIGMLSVLVSFIVANLFSFMNINISKSTLIGVLCGALTTTPGLATACENKTTIIEEATVGYGCTYIFGVIFAVLAVQIITRKEQIYSDFRSINKKIKSKAIYGGLLQISLIIILGKIIGSLNIPIIDFSLGDSGGILYCGILFGVLIKHFSKEKIILKDSRDFIRNIGLILFFVGNGLLAGMKITYNFSVLSVLFGIILTCVSIFSCFIICKLILKNNDLDTAVIIAGSMTSSPAIGVLVPKSDSVLNKYSYSYIGALLMIIFIMKINFIA